MKTGLLIDNDIHEFEKQSLVTEPGGFDWWKCKKCGLRGKRFGLGSSVIQVTGKKSLIENCTGQPQVQAENELKRIGYQVTHQNSHNQVVEPIYEEPQDTKNPQDVLEVAAQLVKESENSILPEPQSIRDNFFVDVGVLRGLNFSESFIRFVKAVKLYKLTENKRYKKELGIPNFNALCQKIGVKLSTGKKLVSQIKSFGEQGYKALLETNLKQKDLDMLQRSEPDIKTGEGNPTVTFAGETVEIKPGNEELLLNLIEKQQKENDYLNKEVADLYEKNENLDNKNKELKDLLCEESNPENAIENAQKKCQEIQDSFLRHITTLNKLHEKNPDNSQITEIIVSTIVYIDGLNSSLKAIFNCAADNDESGIMTPEDILHKLGDEKED